MRRGNQPPVSVSRFPWVWPYRSPTTADFRSHLGHVLLLRWPGDLSVLRLFMAEDVLHSVPTGKCHYHFNGIRSYHDIFHPAQAVV